VRAGLARVAIGHGEPEGPYTATAGYRGTRAEEPIRVTVVYFVTPIGTVTQKDMETFANNGLRTLCIAYRYVPEEEYLQWSRTYDAATNAIKDREDEIDKANALLEHSLLILGATALEDKLQEGVPEAIEMLHQAGIKLWILTGQ